LTHAGPPYESFSEPICMGVRIGVLREFMRCSRRRNEDRVRIANQASDCLAKSLLDVLSIPAPHGAL